MLKWLNALQALGKEQKGRKHLSQKGTGWRKYLLKAQRKIEKGNGEKKKNKNRTKKMETKRGGRVRTRLRRGGSPENLNPKNHRSVNDGEKGRCWRGRRSRRRLQMSGAIGNF